MPEEEYEYIMDEDDKSIDEHSLKSTFIQQDFLHKNKKDNQSYVMPYLQGILDIDQIITN
jgi:hypothetical protein